MDYPSGAMRAEVRLSTKRRAVRLVHVQDDATHYVAWDDMADVQVAYLRDPGISFATWATEVIGALLHREAVIGEEL